MDEEEKDDTHIAVFNGKAIRRKLVEDKWFFSVVDIVGVLTESVDPFAYWRKLKQRLLEEGNETVTNCHTLKMIAQDGKLRETDVGGGSIIWGVWVLYDIYLKKMRVDGIRKDLSNNLINTDNLMLSNDNKMLTYENGN